MKITEIRDLENSTTDNLIVDQNTYILIHDYENFKNRLHDHNATLELLTQKALSLFKNSSKKLAITKASYNTKNEKLKQVQKAKIQGLTNDELLVIKKLLLINLRSFKVMQKLFQENRELQKLLKDSHTFIQKQKEDIKNMKNENETLKKTELHLNKRLESVFRQLKRVSKEFIAGFKNDDDNEVSSNNNGNNSQKVELALDLSTNPKYRFHYENHHLMSIVRNYKEMIYSSNLDTALQCSKIHLTFKIFELPSYNFFNSSSKFRYTNNTETKYPLLVRDIDKAIEYYNRNLKEMYNNNTPVNLSERNFLELSLESNECLTDNCHVNSENNIQNVVTLNGVNSSVWNVFMVMKSIQELIMLNEIFENMKAFLIDEENSFDSDQAMQFQTDSINPNLFESENTNEFICPSTSISNEITSPSSNKRIDKYKKKHFPKIKVFYSLKHTHKKLVNGTSNSEISRKQISQNRSYPIRKNRSIGVGDSSTVLVDCSFQVDSDIFINSKLEPQYDRNYNIDLEKEELNKKESSLKMLSDRGKDFRQSLKSLEEIIKSCQLKAEQESMTKLKDKLKRSRFNSEDKHFNLQRKVDTKVKEVKKKKHSSYESYKKENRKIAELPEMCRMYQIILENKLPRGVSFEYLTPDKSKVQLLFVSNQRQFSKGML